MSKYVTIKEEYIDELKSNVKLLKHTKSGARVLLIPCDDNNKTFTVGFRTPPVDDTGVPHILEHSTLCGSKKFPVKDPFVELLKSSLNTFLNAMTYPDKTIYPIASCNDKDFKNLMEVYMDAVFYPNVYIHEEIFKQEGWHYELEDKDGEIKYNGVVYNEMKGAFSSVDEVVTRQMLHSLFPNTTYGVESGGDPEYIPNLSYEQFKAFHTKFYSPANAYIILYGNCDMEERLEWMDKEYLSKFDIVDVDSHIDLEKEFMSPATDKIYYNVGKEGETKDKTQYAYGAVIGKYDDVVLSYAFQTLSYVLLEAPGAPLRQALLDNLCKDVDSTYDDGILQPALLVTAKDCPEGKLEDFKNIINNTLKEVVKNGIDKKALRASINSTAFKLKEADFGRAPKGLVFTIEALGTWLYDENDPFTRLKYNSIVEKLESLVDTNYFEELIEKYLINNKHISFIEVVPSKTIGDEKEAETKKKLEAYKNSLSKEQIEKLVEDTKALKVYQATPSTKEELAMLPKLSRDDISVEASHIYNKEENYNGVTIVKHDLETSGIGYLTLNFKYTVEDNMIPYAAFLASVLGDLSTKNYTYQELDKEIDIQTGGITFGLNVYRDKEGNALPYIQVTTKYLYGKEKETISLIKEIITTTIFDNKARINELVNESLSALQQKVMYGGHQAAFTRCLSYVSEADYIKDASTGIAAYDFFKNLAANFDQEYDNVINAFKDLMNKVFRKENLIISYTGKCDAYKDQLDDLISSLYNKEYNIKPYTYIPNVLNEGIKTPGQVQYVARAAKYDKNLYNGAISVLNVALRYDYLWNQVRVLGGAYGVMINASPTGEAGFVSYRDPNLSRTSKVFDEVLNYIDNFNPTDAELTNFIIAAIGEEDQPNTPRIEGNISMIRYFRGTTEAELQQYRNEIINATVDSIKKVRPVYEQVLKTNNICVLGNENKIEQEGSMFKNKRNLM